LDRDRCLLNLLDYTQRSYWIGGVGNDQHQHKLELECGYATGRMHC
jgi:hypothetical protein